MKKNILIFLSAFLFGSCDNILDQQPRDRYSENIVWTDINLVDNYLKGCYRNLKIQGLDAWAGLINIDGLSDDIYFIHIFGTNLFLEGNITSANQGPFTDVFFASLNWTLFSNIHAINQFIERSDALKENNSGNPENLKIIDRMIGEALFLRAYCYSKLATTYGGVPLLAQTVELGEDYNQIKRTSFEETINFIVADCDEAAKKLWSKESTEMGRANNATALALKSRILLFAASDLTADGTVNDPLIAYQNPNRQQLWTKAREAAAEVIALGTYSLPVFGENNEDISKNYYELFKQKDLGNPEVIWGKMYRQDVGDFRETNLQNGPNGNSNWGSNNPTQELVDAYRMADGSDFFDHFKVDQNGNYINISNKYTSPNPYDNREARFYGSILFDGAKWQPRFSNLAERDPVGIYDRRTKIYLRNGVETQVIPGIDTRQGPVTPEDGGYTGYLMKKHLDDKIVGRDERNNNAWIEFRYAEVLLNYIESSIELGENAQAEIYLNQIRNRAGLPNVTGNLKEELRKERRIELVFENHRWYDMRRWKVLTGMKNAKGMVINEYIDTDKNTSRTSWSLIDAQNRNIKDEKLYWIPIPFDEISRAPQLEQNPGY